MIGKGRTKNNVPVGIGYRPAGTGWSSETEIIAQFDDGPGSSGSTISPSRMLQFKHHEVKWIEENGQRKFGGLDIEENWFEHRCKEANCEWFVPMVKRMATGEDVPLEEIQAAYLAHNGQPMPCGEWSKLFR